MRYLLPRILTGPKESFFPSSLTPFRICATFIMALGTSARSEVSRLNESDILGLLDKYYLIKCDTFAHTLLKSIECVRLSYMTKQYLIKLSVSYTGDQKCEFRSNVEQEPQKVHEIQNNANISTALEEPLYTFDYEVGVVNRIMNKIFRKTERIRSRHKNYRHNSNYTIKKNNRSTAYLIKRKNYEEVFL